MARQVAGCRSTGWLQRVGVHPVIGRLLAAAVVLDYPAFTDTRGDTTHTWREQQFKLFGWHKSSFVKHTKQAHIQNGITESSDQALIMHDSPHCPWVLLRKCSMARLTTTVQNGLRET